MHKRTRRHKRFLLLSLPGYFFFLLLCGRVEARTYDFISYGVEEGLSQSEARCVLQDSRGYLWVGTMGGGVCSFDGLKFREYGRKDGLAGQMVTCMAEDSSGNMWFGTVQGGVSLYDGKTFTTFDDKNGLDNNDIRCLIATKTGVLIGVPGGIFEYNLQTKLIRRIATLSDLLAMCVDENSNLWAGTREGFFRVANGTVTPVPMSLQPGRQKAVTAVRCDGHGLVYLGLDDGLLIYRRSTGTFTENALTEMVAGKQVRAIFLAADKATWIGTLNNLVVRYYDENRFIRYDRSNGLTAESVFMITEDDTRHTWMATREQSLLKLRSETFTYYGNDKGMGTGTVFPIMEDHAGNIWVGSTEDGVYKYDGVISRAVLNNGLPFIRPAAFAEDREKNTWIGHGSGLTCMAGDRAIKQMLPGIRVRALLYDSKGNLWIGTWGKGVYRYDGKEMTNYTAEQGELAGNFVHVIYEARNGVIWIGTGSGLVKYDGKTFTSYNTDEGLCNLYIGSIAEDDYGNIWFHTDLCIMRFNGKQFASYGESNGIASNTVYLLAFDTAGQLWVGTNKGIDRVRLDATGRVLGVKNYSRNEGFRGIECNSRSVCRARDGSLWFGTVKGVIRYDPSADRQDDVEPIIQVTGIRLFLEPTDWSWTGVGEEGWYHLPKKLELDDEHNHLTFLYQGIHLASPQATKYKFMLAGFDSTWQPVTTSTEFTYTNLPPGTYVFHVMASNAEGKWNAKSAVSCQIVILPPPPPYWMRWWFIALVVLAIGGSLFYFISGRSRRVMRQRQELEAEVLERTLEISRQNQEKTLMLKEIHHRVKNNLQVISSLLNLQAESITDKRVLSLFEDCRHRVNSMALIHEKMYQSKNLANIDIRSYIDELTRSLIDAYDSNKSIRLHADIEDHPFRIDTIVPLGLILNEIISNSLKYAFDQKTEGDLFVSLHRIGPRRFMLEVSDNGKGIPDTIDFHKAESLGMQLIQMLSGQINGKVDVMRNGGTKYRIEFEEEVKDRF